MTSCHEVMTRDVSRRGSRRHGVGPGAAAGQLHHGQSGPPAWPRLSPRPGQVHHDRPPERTGGDATLREQQPGADRRRFQHTRPRRPRVPPRPRAAHDHRLPGILEVVCAKDQRPEPDPGLLRRPRGGYHGFLYQKGRFRTIDVPSKPIQAWASTIAARSLVEPSTPVPAGSADFCWKTVFTPPSTSPGTCPPTRWTSTTAVTSRVCMRMPANRPWISARPDRRFHVTRRGRRTSSPPQLGHTALSSSAQVLQNVHS